MKKQPKSRAHLRGMTDKQIEQLQSLQLQLQLSWHKLRVAIARSSIPISPTTDATKQNDTQTK